MQKILGKRILRDLKENLVRYLLLGMLIILSMYVVVSLIGTADTIILGSEKWAEDNVLEDGEFSTFVPLSEAEKKLLTEKGITLEEQFYLDCALSDGSVLRVFKNREKLNLVEVTRGKALEKETELVLEQRYADVHGLNAGDHIKIGGKDFLITGLGCSPDYDAPYKDFSGGSINSEQFGTAFVTEKDYEGLLKDTDGLKAEEYVYAYRLGKNVSAEELKEILEEIKIAPENVPDEFFQEYWKEQTRDLTKMKEGINSLVDGSKKLENGLDDLSDVSLMFPVMKEGVSSLHEGSKELHTGLKELKKETDSFLKEQFEPELSKLRFLLKASDNMRIQAAASDQVLSKYSGMMAGAIVLILFAYVISVFVVYGIEKENTTIGALYALGVKRGELIFHYLCLPVLVTFVAGIIGCVIGFLAIGKTSLAGSSFTYFSIPDMESVYPAYLVVYGILMPPVLSFLVNWFVIRKKLNQPALKLLRNEQKSVHTRQFNIKRGGFVAAFRIRQMLREARTSLTVVGGMFISLLILMLGLDCYVMCEATSVDNKKDTRFEYAYTYKYPETSVPEGGYEAYVKTVKKETLGYRHDVSILGITKENPYFDVKLTDSKNDIVISSAMAEKFGLKKGDVFTVEDEEAKMHYAFTVNEIAPYSVGFYIFMQIDCMREMFGAGDSYFNQVFSDKELDIEPGRLYGITTKKDIEKAADVFIENMMPMVVMLTVFSSLIFAVVMYLMMKVMIERCTFHISMLKVFGFRKKEVRRLYLDGNFYVVALASLVCIPLSKKCMDLFYPYLVSNVSCGINIVFPWWMYLLVYGAVLVLYLGINALLSAKLGRVQLAQALKNRE